MFVRIARFEGSDPSQVDESIERVRAMMEDGPTPPGLEHARRSMMLVDRQTGTGLGVTFFDTEDDLRAGDQALNDMWEPARRSNRRAHGGGNPTRWRSTKSGASGVEARQCPGLRRGPVLPGPLGMSVHALFGYPTAPHSGVSAGCRDRRRSWAARCRLSAPSREGLPERRLLDHGPGRTDR